MVKNLPEMQEMHVRSQGLEDLLEEGMATHFIILTWRIPWTEKPDGLQSIGSQRIGQFIYNFQFILWFTGFLFSYQIILL